MPIVYEVYDFDVIPPLFPFIASNDPVPILVFKMIGHKSPVKPKFNNDDIYASCIPPMSYCADDSCHAYQAKNLCLCR